MAVFNTYDVILDIIYCGRRLNKKIHPVSNIQQGSNSESCRYHIIQMSLNAAKIKEDDCFLDVGCGLGRVLAYLKNKTKKTVLAGIEVNPKTYNECAKWAKKTRVNVINGNVFDINLAGYTVFFIGHTFCLDTFFEFIKKIENEVCGKTNLIIVADLDYGDIIDNRKGWLLQYRKELYKYKNMYLLSKPNRFSIWTYTPQLNIK